jgi:hypothetical protein
MNTEVAMLISAGIAGVISLLTLLITRFFDARSEKRKERENFFFVVFPKRLELYEELIKVTDFIASPKVITDSESAESLCGYLMEKCNILADIIYRCNTYASIPITGTLTLIYNLLDEFGKNTFGKYDLPAIKNVYVKLFMPKALELRIELITFIREESGAYLVDKKISDFLRDIKIKEHIPKNSGNDTGTKCG